MRPLAPFAVVGAVSLALASDEVPSDQVVTGAPRVGALVLGELAGGEIGIWEMTAGGMRDIEVDEIFVVIAGSAVVTLRDGAGSRSVALGTGDVCRLEAGMRTEWHVSERVRKVYLAGGPTP